MWFFILVIEIVVNGISFSKLELVLLENHLNSLIYYQLKFKKLSQKNSICLVVQNAPCVFMVKH